MSGRDWETIALVLIFVLGPGLGLRFEAMKRSTIPVALDHVVLSKDLRSEKKPPVDDACRLRLRPSVGGEDLVLRVDHAVFDQVEPDMRLRKSAGEERLLVGERQVPLSPSRDAAGTGLPLGLAWMTVLAAMTGIVRRRAGPTCPPSPPSRAPAPGLSGAPRSRS